MAEPSLILIADDREDIHKALRLLLKAKNYRTDSVYRPEEVTAALEKRRYDALLLDLNYTRDTTSGREGLDLLPKIKKISPHLPVIVMTAYGSIDLAVETLRRGAGDFIEKPWDNQRLLTIVETQIQLSKSLAREERLREENKLLRAGNEHLIADSPVMRPVLDLIERIAPTDVNLLITGEHGTGKSLIARLIHARSSRSAQSLITVNIGAISDTLFESELFGHVRGAYTDAREARKGRFQLADRGTLFLDEIGNLPLELQAKLLRVIETGEYEPVGSSRTERADARIVSATNADLQKLVGEGRFREDLLFRLNTIQIQAPPLRERGEDVPVLAAFFLEKYASQYGRAELEFSPEALTALNRHHWPGNVRELDHAVQRGVLMARADTVRVDDLGLVPLSDPPQSLENMTLDQVERLLIAKAINRTRGNVKEAARALGLSRGSLYRRMEKYGIGHETSQ